MTRSWETRSWACRPVTGICHEPMIEGDSWQIPVTGRHACSETGVYILIHMRARRQVMGGRYRLWAAIRASTSDTVCCVLYVLHGVWCMRAAVCNNIWCISYGVRVYVVWCVGVCCMVCGCMLYGVWVYVVWGRLHPTLSVVCCMLYGVWCMRAAVSDNIWCILYRV